MTAEPQPIRFGWADLLPVRALVKVPAKALQCRVLLAGSSMRGRPEDGESSAL